MRIISSKEVELNEFEQQAKVYFERLLDGGHSVLSSAARVEEVHLGLDPAFYRWLKGEPVMPSGQ